jgi:hypothetical protein
MEKQAYSVQEFCDAFSISRATFYNLAGSGNGPRTMKVGGRTLVSCKAADDWRRRMEARTARIATPKLRVAPASNEAAARSTGSKH